MRYTIENPFVQYECRRLGVENAPIATNMYESYAQCNEDVIVESFLRAATYRAGRPMSSLRYIEIGANHPVQTSSTYLLYRVHSASGVLVEANPQLIDNLKKYRPSDIILNCAVTAAPVEKVEIHIHEKNELSSMSLEHIEKFSSFGGANGVVETISVEAIDINALMKKYFGDHIDFLSVDVEGFDLELLRSMDPVFQPLVIQCEHEGKLDQFGALLGGKGYALCAVTDVNAIYVRLRVSELIFEPDFVLSSRDANLATPS